MLLGRGAELARLDGLLAGLSEGLGFALVLAGDIGAGKSALLDAVAERSGAGQVLRAFGMPSESEVAFSGLSELAQPLLADVAALPARERDTLRSVLALSDGDTRCTRSSPGRNWNGGLAGSPWPTPQRPRGWPWPNSSASRCSRPRRCTSSPRPKLRWAATPGRARTPNARSPSLPTAPS